MRRAGYGRTSPLRAIYGVVDLDIQGKGSGWGISAARYIDRNLKTTPTELTFRLHGNPVRQMTIQAKHVKGGGEPCTR